MKTYHWTKVWHDAARSRYVVRRIAGKIDRSTCIRYGGKWRRDVARHRAHWIAFRLRRCALHNLREFDFKS